MVAPIKWKMLAVTITVILVLLNSFNPVIQQVLGFTGFPVLLKSLIGISFMVSLSTYVIMPFVSKLLWGWRYTSEEYGLFIDEFTTMELLRM